MWIMMYILWQARKVLLTRGIVWSWCTLTSAEGADNQRHHGISWNIEWSTKFGVINMPPFSSRTEHTKSTLLQTNRTRAVANYYYTKTMPVFFIHGNTCMERNCPRRFHLIRTSFLLNNSSPKQAQGHVPMNSSSVVSVRLWMSQ